MLALDQLGPALALVVDVPSDVGAQGVEIDSGMVVMS